MPRKIFTQELEGTRRRGRPRKGWREEVERDLHSRTGRDETKRKTQERMERRSRKRSSSAGSEKM